MRQRLAASQAMRGGTAGGGSTNRGRGTQFVEVLGDEGMLTSTMFCERILTWHVPLREKREALELSSLELENVSCDGSHE